MAFDLDLKSRGVELIVNISAMFLILVSGLGMAFVYYFMNTIQTAFEGVDCLIPQNVFVSTCQEWFNLALFPILNLKYVLIYASYFFVFGIVIGLFYMGFKTRKHPVLLIVHILYSLIIGYLAIEIANIYRTLIDNPVLYEIVTPFAIWNKIMLYFPQFFFFVFFLSGIIGFMGVFKNKNVYDEGTEELG